MPTPIRLRGSTLSVDTQPGVKRATRFEIDAEVVPLTRLIVPTLDGECIEVAIPKRANAAVPDDEYIVGRWTQEIGQTLHDAPLCVDGALPAAHAAFGLGEERVCEDLELRGRHEADGAAIVLADARPDLEG